MEYFRAQTTGLIDLLKAFPSCRPPLALLVEHLPRLLPRPYSVSSCRSSPSLNFVYTVVESPRPGLATAWLASLQPEKDSVRLFPRQGRSFRPPALVDSLIMVCAGSGIGPFYGFLRHLEQERMVYRGPLGQSWLIFGCRSRKHDYLYGEELQELADRGVLGRLTVCFSREQDDGGNEVVTAKGDVTESGSGDVTSEKGDSSNTKMGRKYVQDGMAEAGEELAAWILDKESKFYVCGDAANMGRAVQAALIQLLTRHGGPKLGSVSAADYVARMVVEKRYLQDVWV